MKTKCLVTNRNWPDTNILKEAAELIKKGELVAFPTETVYGLGANGLDAAAAEKIYKAKGRPSDNPLILHVATKEEVNQLVKDISPQAKMLMDKCVYSDIVKETGASTATVSRVNRSLQNGNDSYEKLFKRIEDKK